nr:copia protein [Tanacetum cinerariifolium]
MWLFKHKFHANGTLSCYKARLVANGSSQQQGIDVDETFSPVVKPATICTILSLAVSRKWPIHQLDVKNAFLNAFSIWTETSTPCLVLAFCRLCHSGWVLSQSMRYFFFYLPIGQIITSLHQEFDMTHLGALNYFLGISATRSSTGLFLSQKKYACELLERANMVNFNPSRTPVDTDSKLGPEGFAVQDPTLYRSLAGGLQYLTFTHLDLSYAVQQICLDMHDPWEPHFATLKCILRYVWGTVDFSLQLYASATTSLVGYTDADWAGCPSTRRSTFGYCVFLGDNLLSWSSKRQHTISRSSVKAEYHGVANVVAKTAWLRNLLRELHSPLSTATLIHQRHVDNDLGVSATSELFTLTCGLTLTPISVKSCVVNGVRFFVYSRDERRTTQKSGICSPDGKDGEMCYGQLQKILKFSYLSFKVVLLRVKWFDTRNEGRKVKHLVLRNNMIQILIKEEDPDVIHFDYSPDLPLSTSLNDLDNTTLHIDGQSTEVDAALDIIDLDEDDDIIDDEDALPHDLADSDDDGVDVVYSSEKED